DDDPDCLQVVAASLKEYEVLPLREAEGLVGRAQEFAPDLLILDIQMGDTDGFTLCRDLKGRRATSAIPVVFLSGLAGAEDFLAAFGAGGSVYLTKPLDPADLRRIVADLLRSRPSGGAEPR
ncbi:response regulator, partial [bacterium]